MAGTALLMICCITVIVACVAPSAAPTPDVDATVAAALAATNTAQADLQQTVDAAVRATGAVAPATPDTQATIEAAVRATLVAAPTPTPAVEYITLSEEELAALVDDAVAEATAASTASTTAVTEATADDTLTAEEIELLLSYLDETLLLIADAEELLMAYESLYGDLAVETMALLQAMEEDLAVIAANTVLLIATLEQVEAALSQGAVLTEETLAQLAEAAQAAQQRALQLQQQSEVWIAQLPADLESRAAAALAIAPNNLPTDRLTALQSAFAYVDEVRWALGDNKLSAAELASIAQLGANASAGLKAQGGPALQGLGDSINDITSYLARGQMPQAQIGLSTLESALGARPGRP